MEKQDIITTDRGAEESVPCFSEKIGNMTYHVLIHFNEQSRQNVQDKLKRVILLEAGASGKE